MIIREIDGSIFTEDDSGMPRILTPKELITYAAEIQAFRDNQQLAKPLELKQCENNFLLLCQQLTGKREKVGFQTLRVIIESMLVSDPNTAVVLSLKLLSIDAEGKRFSPTWWDNVNWHSEIAE